MTALDSTACPSEFALERFRLGEVPRTPAQAGHLDSCPSCQARLHALAAPPPVLDLSSVARDARAGWWARLVDQRLFRFGLPAVAVAAAGLALVVGVPRPTDLTKGPAFGLSVIARTGDGAVRAVAPGTGLRARDQLRFEVSNTGAPAHVALVLLDARGTVSPLAPVSGETTLFPTNTRRLLDGAVELDDSVGRERIVLVACPQPRAVAAVVESARGALLRAGGDPARVTGLGTGCHEETTWIEKVSP